MQMLFVLIPLWIGIFHGQVVWNDSQASSAVGRFHLVSANGQSLPAVVAENRSTGFKQEVIAGDAELRADRTCTVATEYRYTTDGEVSTSWSRDECTFATSGQEVRFKFRSGELVGTLQADLLTVRADAELVYRRR
ncbi:MAG: hypothetical protein AB1898_12755 [Acidobacteriota bacterium]